MRPNTIFRPDTSLRFDLSSEFELDQVKTLTIKQNFKDYFKPNLNFKRVISTFKTKPKV